MPRDWIVGCQSCKAASAADKQDSMLGARGDVICTSAHIDKSLVPAACLARRFWHKQYAAEDARDSEALVREASDPR
jgi:hypothetical protein